MQHACFFIMQEQAECTAWNVLTFDCIMNALSHHLITSLGITCIRRFARHVTHNAWTTPAPSEKHTKMPYTYLIWIWAAVDLVPRSHHWNVAQLELIEHLQFGLVVVGGLSVCACMCARARVCDHTQTQGGVCMGTNI